MFSKSKVIKLHNVTSIFYQLNISISALGNPSQGAWEQR